MIASLAPNLALLLAITSLAYATELAQPPEGVVNDAEHYLTPPLAAQFLPAGADNKELAASAPMALLGRALTCPAGEGYCTSQ